MRSFRADRATRVARGAIAASIATFAALLSHVVAGGDVPGWAGIVAPWILALAVCTLLAGRALSLVRLASSVVVSQLLFHTLFVMGSPSASSSSSGAAAGHAHLHGAMTTMIPDAADPTLAALCADPVMWIGHAIAAVATIVALYRGERAARAMLALAAELRAWAQRVVARVIVTTRVQRHRGIHIWIAPPVLLPAHLTIQRRRGPPPSIAL